MMYDKEAFKSSILKTNYLRWQEDSK